MEQQSFNFEAVVTKGDSPPSERGLSPLTPRIYKVSEIVRLARGTLEERFGDIWVTGEISNLTTSGLGHIYFALKDDSGLLNAIMFRGEANKLNFKLTDGLEVICHGRLSIYEKAGKFQIIVDFAEPKGVGALQLAFEQLKKRLGAEGLFDPRHKKKLPFLPKKIGVVTSPTGAAIRDILNILKRRFPNVDVLLYPVKVQGDGAAGEIAQAIVEMNKLDDVDVMIVGRGGGSLEDLWAFNEEIVARAIFASRIPIINAVGHEIDFTIADFVADVRAPTPSAAAEIATPKKEELYRMLDDKRRALLLAARRLIDRKGEFLSRVRSHLKAPSAKFISLLQELDNLRERLGFSTKTLLTRKTHELNQLTGELRHLSPFAVMAKGYSIVCKEGNPKPIKSNKEVSLGDSLDIRFYEGGAGAKVTRLRRSS